MPFSTAFFYVTLYRRYLSLVLKCAVKQRALVRIILQELTSQDVNIGGWVLEGWQTILTWMLIPLLFSNLLHNYVIWLPASSNIFKALEELGKIINQDMQLTPCRAHLNDLMKACVKGVHSFSFSENVPGFIYKQFPSINDARRHI